MRIKGRTAIVTGASSGIGRSTALLLANRGANVVAAGRNPERLADVAASHERITAVVGDVRSPADRSALIDAGREVGGGVIDILINNAGVGWAGRIETMPEEDVRAVFETNVLALIDLSQRVLPGMREAGRGHISNVSSVLGFVAGPPLSVYSSSKWAVQGFSDGLRREHLGTGVTVSCIDPGPVATRFLPRAIAADRHEVPTVPGGIPPWLVAFAIERGIRIGRLPGYGQISVPRFMGLLRLAEVPGVRALLDVVGGASTGLVRRLGA